MSHTPTPWTVDHSTGEILASDRRIASTQNGGVFKVNDAEFIVKACNAHDELVAALKRSMTAVDDWLNTYASELCNEDRVKEASERIGQYGTLAYIAHVQEASREALAKAGAL